MTNSTARDMAVKRLKDKRSFTRNLVAYVVVNAFLIGIWAVSGGGYFWPVWVILGWGIGIVFHAWDVYWQKPITEADIQEEMRKGGGTVV